MVKNGIGVEDQLLKKVIAVKNNLVDKKVKGPSVLNDLNVGVNN